MASNTEIIKSGSGETPSKDCSIIIHIKAAHLDGTVIENSFDKETPWQFHISNFTLLGLSKATVPDESRRSMEAISPL